METRSSAWMIRTLWLGVKEIYVVISALAQFVGRMTLLTIGLILAIFTGGYSVGWAASFCDWLDEKAPRPVRDLVYGYWAILGLKAVNFILTLDF